MNYQAVNDEVYVATAPGSHLDYALMACEAGKPAYVEKPMARSLSECRRMVEALPKGDGGRNKRPGGGGGGGGFGRKRREPRW